MKKFSCSLSARSFSVQCGCSILVVFLLSSERTLAKFNQPPDGSACVFGQLPANRNASKSAVQLLGWLGSLPGRSANKILSGQFCGYPNPHPQLLAKTHPWSTYRKDYMEDVFKMTGKYPAIMGVDYFGNKDEINTPAGIKTTEHSDHRVLNYKAVNKDLIDWWNAGGLVTINIHGYRPDTHQPDYTGYYMKFGFGGSNKYPPDENYKEYALDRLLPNGADRANWLAMMDQMALGLTELREAGVVVLWRPFHEMNAGFWWGKHDAELFKKVWQDMFTHFSKTKKLNNLLWVFTGSPAYYPGDDFVDINGQDTYQQEANKDEMYDFSLRTCKPYALTEFGFGIDKDRDNSSASYDFEKLLRSIKSNIPQSVYFLVWSDAWRIANPNHQHQKELLDDPMIITRDEVDFRNYVHSDKQKR